MSLRAFSRWLGVRGGVAVAVLGVLFAVGGLAAQLHASRGTVYQPDQPIEVAGSWPRYVVGVITPGGGATEESIRCSVVLGGEAAETVNVGVRRDRLDSIRVGRRLPSGATTLTCDRRVAVNAGPAVFAYPLATSTALFPAYLAIAALGLVAARQQVRDRRRGRASHSPPSSSSDSTSVAAVPEDRFQIDSVPAVVDVRRGRAGILFLLSLVGLVAMLAISIVSDDWRLRDTVLNLVLLLLVLPTAIGAGVLLRR